MTLRGTIIPDMEKIARSVSTSLTQISRLRPLQSGSDRQQHPKLPGDVLAHLGSSWRRISPALEDIMASVSPATAEAAEASFASLPWCAQLPLMTSSGASASVLNVTLWNKFALDSDACLQSQRIMGVTSAGMSDTLDGSQHHAAKLWLQSGTCSACAGKSSLQIFYSVVVIKVMT